MVYGWLIELVSHSPTHKLGIKMPMKEYKGVLELQYVVISDIGIPVKWEDLVCVWIFAACVELWNSHWSEILGHLKSRIEESAGNGSDGFQHNLSPEGSIAKIKRIIKINQSLDNPSSFHFWWQTPYFRPWHLNHSVPASIFLKIFSSALTLTLLSQC